jgi:hypothetical protein
VRGNAEVKVYVVRVGALVPVEMEPLGIELARIRGLYCAVDRETAERHNKDRPNFVLVPAADSRRWRAATKALLRAMKTVRRRVRGRRLRSANYGAVIARVGGYVRDACEVYRDKAGDLSRLVEAAQERQMRRRRDGRDHQEHHREVRERWERGLEHRNRDKRAAMAGAPGEPAWAYVLYTLGARHRCFRIRLPAVEDHALLPSHGLPIEIATRTGLTPQQVQSALAAERSRHRHTIVEWGPDTKSVLEEWHESGTVEKAWQELTGELVDPDPRPPNEQRESQRFGGPSSDYFGPGGFGPHI